MSTGWTQALLVVGVALVMGSFAAGVIGNIRRGNAVLRWMQGGLPRLGEKTTLRWLGTSVVELGIQKARPPFRRVELLVVMVPRDVPWLWLWSRAQGRRDMLILRGQLVTAPRLEYDIIQPGSWSARSARARAENARWGNEALDAHTLYAPRASLPVSRGDAPALVKAAQNVHPTVWRVALRREYPQLELHVPLPDPKKVDAHRFFDAMCSLAQQSVAS